MPVIIASSIKEANALINGGKYREIINPRGTFMWLFIGTFAVAFLASLMLVWLDDRIAETD